MKIYCNTCNRMVDYIIEPAPSRFGKIKGRYYIYDGEIARCSICGHEVYTEETREYNKCKLDEKVEEQKCSVKQLVG